MDQDQEPVEPGEDQQPERPRRIRGVVRRKSIEELEQRGLVIP